MNQMVVVHKYSYMFRRIMKPSSGLCFKNIRVGYMEENITKL